MIVISKKYRCYIRVLRLLVPCNTYCNTCTFLVFLLLLFFFGCKGTAFGRKISVHFDHFYSSCAKFSVSAPPIHKTDSPPPRMPP